MSGARILFLMLVLSIYGVSSASDKHSTSEKDHKEGHNEKDGHNHKEGESGEEEEETGNVGPDKGITEYSERNGFKLSSEALKNFELRFIKLDGDGPWAIPKSAIVYSGEERNLFRRRKDFFKRIDFQTQKSTDKQLTVDSDDLREDDEIVLIGLGFLRIAELAATGGVAHGHSH